MLLAPVILAGAVIYRKKLGKADFVWNISEMVLVTIVFFIVSLLLVIVSVTCFFSHWGYLNALQLESGLQGHFLSLGVSCALFLAGMTMIYVALRKVLVQMVTREGVMLSEKMIPLPGSLMIVKWDDIADYYIVPDYPNAVCNFIVNDDRRSDLKFQRYSIKVPIFMKEDFIAYMEKKIYSSNTIHRDDSRMSQRYFSEN